MAVTSTAASGWRNRWIITLVVCVAFGGWFFYDGWVNPKYQEGGEKYEEQKQQQVIAVALGVVSLGVLVYMFASVMPMKVQATDEGLIWKSNAAVPWDAFNGADLTRLDKGIMELTYSQNNTSGQVKLDEYQLTNFADLVEFVGQKRPDLVPVEADTDEHNNDADPTS